MSEDTGQEEILGRHSVSGADFTVLSAIRGAKRRMTTQGETYKQSHAQGIFDEDQKIFEESSSVPRQTDH